MGLLLVTNIEFALSGNRITLSGLPDEQTQESPEMKFRLSLLLSPKELSHFPIPLGVSDVGPCLAFNAGSFFQLTLVHVDNNRVRLRTCLQGFPWNRDQSVTGPK